MFRQHICRLFKDDRRFARKHFDKAAKQFLVLMLTKDCRICSLSVSLHSIVVKGEFSLLDSHSAPFDISSVFHCDGLLLCASENGSTIVVWNPCTGETKWIHTGNLFRTYRALALGYYQDNQSCNKSYKILSLLDLSGQVSIIYDFDSDSWRIFDDLTPGWSVSYSHSGLSLKGNTYWFASHETQTHLGISLCKFDFSTEKSEPVPLPYQCSRYETAILSVIREEKLSVLLQRDYTSKTEIWVTNKIDETKVVSWTKVLALDLSPDLQISYEGSFLLDEEKKVIVCCDRWIDDEDDTMSKDMVYIVGEDNKVTPVGFGVDTMDECWPAILNYVPSLVRIKPHGGKRKICRLHI